MGTISAVSFVYNEGQYLEASMQALKPYVDELIIANLESTDNTRAIADKYGDFVFDCPWLICGDQYKMELSEAASCEWILWFYADEIFPEKTAEALRVITETEEYTAFAFMRQEYMDDVRLAVAPNVFHGTPESPNYQNRLHKKLPRVFYNGLVHWEVPKELHTCPLPPEYYMEHRKTSTDQEFDNRRLYIYYHYLIWLYGDTRVEPYVQQIASYRQIVRDSEAKNLTGERKICLAEEFWWKWRKYADQPRINLMEFKDITGMEYAEFLHRRNSGDGKAFMIEANVVDRALTEQGDAD